MKEIKAYSNVASVEKAQNKVAIKTIKHGDIINYKILEKLDNNKYKVNIFGHKITTTINEKVPLSGNAKVIISDNSIILKIVKEDNRSLYNTNNNADDNIAKNILRENAIKTTARNISYLDTVLKYMPDISENQKTLVLNYMSKNIYFSVNELCSLFTQKVYIILSKMGFFSKIPKINPLYSENSKTLINYINCESKLDLAIKRGIDNNGHFALLLSMIDSLSDSDKEVINSLKIIISSLVANRKNKLSKKNVYYLPILISLDGKFREIKLLIETNRDDKKSFKMSISSFESGKESFRLDIKSFESEYNITINIFEKKLYDEYIKNESFLFYKIEEVKKNSGLEINIGVVHEK